MRRSQKTSKSVANLHHRLQKLFLFLLNLAQRRPFEFLLGPPADEETEEKQSEDDEFNQTIKLLTNLVANLEDFEVESEEHCK